MSHFQHHVFICCNQRDNGKPCCNDHGARDLLAYAKERARELALDGERIRINQAGCLGRCDLGPVLVIYPEAIWYSYADQADIDEILIEHLQNGRFVERLLV